MCGIEPGPPGRGRGGPDMTDVPATAPRRLLIATDAWLPQINGVVRTLRQMTDRLTAQGWTVEVVHPGSPGLTSFPLPFYPQIRLALAGRRFLRRAIERFQPDHIHIPAEGPIGLAARGVCVKLGLRFTTSYHTRFPEYVERLLWVPPGLAYRYLRWFHGAASAVMVSTESMRGVLQEKGFERLAHWGRGVDLQLFHPRAKREGVARPLLLFVGRVSAEKNLEAFFALRTPGTKVVVGDGPMLEAYRRQHGAAVEFRGALQGEDLAAAYADADVFVFPSRTDTFGLTIIEALASGVPVAAYPEPGPVDILRVQEGAGALDEDLDAAVARALADGDSARCCAVAAQYTWERSAEQFRTNLVPVRGGT